jgi:hypothetical protein
MNSEFFFPILPAQGEVAHHDVMEPNVRGGLQMRDY